MILNNESLYHYFHWFFCTSKTTMQKRAQIKEIIIDNLIAH